MKPIISGIGSACHRLPIARAKILIPLLVTTDPSHIKNAGKLIEKRGRINMADKLRPCFDMLRTNAFVKNEKLCPIKTTLNHYTTSNLLMGRNRTK